MDYLAALLYIILVVLLLYNMVCSQGSPVFQDRPRLRPLPRHDICK